MTRRIDVFHKTPEENINLLFNMIQACRTDLTILKYRDDIRPLLAKDKGLIEAAEALVRELKI